jgi:cytochrome c oxidase subunit 3
MSESTEEAAAHKPKAGGAGHDAHEGHNEYPYVQHHFDSPGQQLEAGKLGIWLFLVTEILFFAGLFCAYTIYRAKYPEVFYWAHFYLDTKLGAANTIVLILSSLTAAWAVRNAQLGQQKQLTINILITIACACTFMGIKYVEYSHKAHEGLLPGPAFDPQHELWENEDFKAKHPQSVAAMDTLQKGLAEHRAKLAEAAKKPAAPSAAAQGTSAAADDAAEQPDPAARATAAAVEDAEGEGQPKDDAAAEPKDVAAEGNQGKAAEPAAEAGDPTDAAAKPAAAADGEAEPDPTIAARPEDPTVAAAAATPASADEPVSEAIFLASAIRKLSPEAAQPLIDAGIIRRTSEGGAQLRRPDRAHMFFGVYFFMTGLHGAHVLIGIIVWVWLLLRALKGQFGPKYFGPIDFAALYWHLVDLIWIYLFPLLYLIH